MDVAPAVELSIEGFIRQKDDSVIEEMLDMIQRATTVMVVAALDENTVDTMAFTDQTEDSTALARAIQMFGAIGIECHRRMVIGTRAYRELYGEDAAA